MKTAVFFLWLYALLALAQWADTLTDNTWFAAVAILIGMGYVGWRIMDWMGIDDLRRRK